VSPFFSRATVLNETFLICITSVRENASRRPLDKLGRAGAVRQRKEEVHEMNGHTFVAKRFYNIMRCALCGEFMVNSGYQCEGTVWFENIVSIMMFYSDYCNLLCRL
jgi:hypothetical protein